MGVSPVLGKPPYYQSCQPWINKLLGCVILGVWSKYLSWRVPQSFSTPWLNHSHGIFHEIMKSWCIGCILTQLWVSWASMAIQLYEYHMVYDFPWLSSSPAIRVSRIPHFRTPLEPPQHLAISRTPCCEGGPKVSQSSSKSPAVQPAVACGEPNGCCNGWSENLESIQKMDEHTGKWMANEWNIDRKWWETIFIGEIWDNKPWTLEGSLNLSSVPNLWQRIEAETR